MPRLTSSHLKTKTSNEDWVVLAEFTGAESGMDADLWVTTLKGSGIPALRLPTHSLFGGGGLAMLQYAPVRVLVPLDRVADAKELLGDAAMGQSEDGA